MYVVAITEVSSTFSHAAGWHVRIRGFWKWCHNWDSTVSFFLFITETVGWYIHCWRGMTQHDKVNNIPVETVKVEDNLQEFSPHLRHYTFLFLKIGELASFALKHLVFILENPKSADQCSTLWVRSQYLGVRTGDLRPSLSVKRLFREFPDERMRLRNNS